MKRTVIGASCVKVCACLYVCVCMCVCVHMPVYACVFALHLYVYVCTWDAAGRGSLSAGTRWGVIPLQVLWVAVRLDAEQMPCFPYSLALHLSRGSPEVFKVGGSIQTLD